MKFSTWKFWLPALKGNFNLLQIECMNDWFYFPSNGDNKYLSTSVNKGEEFAKYLFFLCSTWWYITRNIKGKEKVKKPSPHILMVSNSCPNRRWVTHTAHPNKQNHKNVIQWIIALPTELEVCKYFCINPLCHICKIFYNRTRSGLF